MATTAAYKKGTKGASTMNRPHHGVFKITTPKWTGLVNVYHNGQCWWVQMPLHDMKWSTCKILGWKLKAVTPVLPGNPGVKKGLGSL